jgi:hypothetical protein
MARLEYDLDRISSYKYSYMICKNCGRKEVEPGVEQCDECGRKLIRSSVYEWNLTDGLREELKKIKVKYKLVEQYPIKTRTGSVYHWDIFVWVKGKSSHGGCGYLIEVNGPEHYTTNGIGKDFKKRRYAVDQPLPKGTAFRAVRNLECTVGTYQKTARKIVKELVERANYG